jgi:chemotaxis signal transduction protein
MSTYPALQVVVFRAGEELFGIPLETVEEIIAAEEIGPGEAMTVRGREVPVVSASACLGLAREHEERRGILLRAMDGVIVITVQHVVGVREIENRTIVPVPDFFRGRTTELVRGISRGEAEPIVLLRPEKLRMRRNNRDTEGSTWEPAGEA